MTPHRGYLATKNTAQIEWGPAFAALDGVARFLLREIEMDQTTLANSVSVSGVGLHTGAEVNLTLRPAPENTGYIFVRTDLDKFEIPASVEYISHCSYATTLVRRGVVLSTCEHLLSALRGSGVDNCFIELDNIEVPILDGSSEDWVELIERAGIAEQDAPRHYLRVKQRVEIEQGDRRMSIEPSDRFEIDCTIDFPHPFINQQKFRFVAENGSYGREIASARTFGFTHEIEMLRKANLALGGSLDNAIVLTDEGMLNETPLRVPDEFVRHKILDIIGDVALVGMPVIGRITAHKSGHAVHAALMSKLLKTPTAWEIV
ncbi:MAG: UDP-3-O-acyl-N-acetylglucosamine deacetylase [Pyrinomonadaceae bacterium]|nr:UDP-3-O-acyl-N-acetylglucosamine deacetylase [Pyrinomonadaceae bacterium]